MTNLEFLTWLEERQQNRPLIPTQTFLKGLDPSTSAVLAVDLINGFCHEGPLASPLVADLLPSARNFLEQAHAHGIRDFFFPCDAHQENSPEFEAFPSHCLEGSAQSEIVSELSTLPFAGQFVRVDKRSVSSMIDTQLASLLLKKPRTHLVCLGDCTDLCLYQLALGLRYLANAQSLPWKVVVPANLVATYDLSLEVSKEIGALPHPSSFMNLVFLYHLELQGVEVCLLG